MLASFSLPSVRDPDPLPRAPTVRVRSADDLRRAVQLARCSALTLDGTGLDRVLGVDRVRARAEVQAAATWTALASHRPLAPFALDAFVRLPALPATVGASACLNCAGPDGAPVSRHIAALTLVTPDGELRRASRSVNADLFALALGGQGIFGVLYSVTLDLASLAAAAAAAQAPVELAFEQGPPAAEDALELLVPPAALERFLDEVRAVCAERRVALRAVAVQRTLAEDETRLRWATREWAVLRLRFAARGSLGAAVYAAETRRDLLARALACGGSLPISDLRDATREQLEACYPALSAFLAEKRRADPADRLQNRWLQRVRAIVQGGRCESRWSN